LHQTYFDFFNGAIQLDPLRPHPYIKYYNVEKEEDPQEEPELFSVGSYPAPVDLGPMAGTGGIVSTPRDEVLFWHSLFNRTTFGAPLLQSAESQKDLLKPWTFTGTGEFHLDHNRILKVWSYYTQGLGIVCLAPHCPHGPRWITYTGCTNTIRSANLMDYENYAMSQVWTTTLVAMTDPNSYHDAINHQTGRVYNVIKDWMVPKYNNPTNLAWIQLLERFPPVAIDSRSMEGRESGSADGSGNTTTTEVKRVIAGT